MPRSIRISLAILITCITYAIQSEGINFSEQRKNHQFKSLGSKKHSRIAGLSDKKLLKKQILQPMLIERIPGTEGSLLTQEHIKFWMDTKLGWSVEEDAFTDDTPFGRKPFVNIIAKLDPNADRFLTLACHYDSKYFEQFEFIGATDSAVPCSIMIDIALTLNYSLHDGRSSSSESVSLQLLFLDGEEAFVEWTEVDSLYGARHLANKWAHTPHHNHPESSLLDAIDAFILLDLIGARSPRFRDMFSDTQNLFKRLAAIEAKLHKSELLENHASPNEYFVSEDFHGGVQDDHIPFLEKGVPILHLISIPFPSVWHTRDDNKSALHYLTIDNVNKILRIFVFEYLHLKL